MMANGIVVKDIQPVDGDKERIISTHSCSWRGLRDAIGVAHDLDDEYIKSNRKAGAHWMTIEALGIEAWAECWEAIAERYMDTHPFNEETIEKCQQRESEELYREEMAEYEAERRWEREERKKGE